MPSHTLAEAAALDFLSGKAGYAEIISKTDQFFQVLPFDFINSYAMAYKREATEGGAAFAGFGQTIGSGASAGDNQANRLLAKNAGSVTQHTDDFKTILSNVEINGLIQGGYSNTEDQLAAAMLARASVIGRIFKDTLINGTGSNEDFQGLLALCDPSQRVNGGGANGDVYSLDRLDELLDKVEDKDNQVDYILMNKRTRRDHHKALRALGGATIAEVVTLPNGQQIEGYKGVPIFVNDNIGIDHVIGTSTNATAVIAGTLSDGSRTVGITAFSPAGEEGIQTEYIGVDDSQDLSKYRLKWYAGLSLFNIHGLAVLENVLPL